MAVKPAATGRRDRRHARHEATRQEILSAAWELMRAEGVAALSLRALARAVGMEPQSLYSYFASKHAIYDAMFAQANTELLARMAEKPEPADAVEALRRHAAMFAGFCVEDPVRYQLLFQRTIPGFEPSGESYALARQVLDGTARRLERAGLAGEAHLEIGTALISGLISQQLANEPGGHRYIRHVDEVIDMYLTHVGRPRRHQ